MTARIDHKDLLAGARIVRAPLSAEPRCCTDQSFELPPVLHFATGAMFLGFVSVLTAAFSNHMAVSFGVIAAFIAAFFAVPTIFARSESFGGQALGWSEFMERGVDTATGRTGAGEAATLVLLLPFLILCFGIAVVTIAALV